MKKATTAFGVLSLIFTVLTVAFYFLGITIPFVIAGAPEYIDVLGSMTQTFDNMGQAFVHLQDAEPNLTSILFLVAIIADVIAIIGWIIGIAVNRRGGSILAVLDGLLFSFVALYVCTFYLIPTGLSGTLPIVAIIDAMDFGPDFLAIAAFSLVTLALLGLALIFTLLLFIFDLVYCARSPKPKKRVYAASTAAGGENRLVLVRDEPAPNAPSSDEIRSLLHEELATTANAPAPERPVEAAPVVQSQPSVMPAAGLAGGVSGPLLVQYINTYGPKAEKPAGVAPYQYPYPCQLGFTAEDVGNVVRCPYLRPGAMCALTNGGCIVLTRKPVEKAEKPEAPKEEKHEEAAKPAPEAPVAKPAPVEKAAPELAEIKQVLEKELPPAPPVAEAAAPCAEEKQEMPEVVKVGPSLDEIRAAIRDEMAREKGEHPEPAAPIIVAMPAPAPVEAPKEEPKPVEPAPTPLVEEDIRRIIREELQGIVIQAEVAPEETAPEEEAPVEEPAPVIEEPVPEEPAPVMEEAPAPAPVEAPKEKEKIIRIPFTDRIRAADKVMKDHYNDLKSDILAYGVNSRVSNSGDAFRLHRKTYVKISIAGKSLKLYLALDPRDYENTTLPIGNAGDKNIYKDIPLVFKVRSDLSLRRAKQLIGDAMEKDKLEQGKIEPHDWVSEIKNTAAEGDDEED